MHNTLVLKKTDLAELAPQASTGGSPTRSARSNHEKWVLLIVVGMVLAAWQIGRLFTYKSGTGMGYDMGLVGGIMMLLLFSYPLRKRFRLLDNLGTTKFWFSLHMSLGVLGPVLVLAHTRFHLGSINATVAFTCMSLVAASGIVGRFIYIKIHQGLYGRRSTLNEMRELSGLASVEAGSKLSFAPRVEKRLTEFEATALKQPAHFLASAFKFLTLPIRAHLTYFICSRELARVYGKHAAQKGWDQDKLKRRLSAARTVTASYLKSAQDVAQFTAYERMFSLWHVLHVPLVYMLVLSAIAHVIAVHIY